MKENLSQKIGLAALALGCAVVVGVATGVAIFAPATPAALRAESAAETMPVGERSFDDKRTVDVALSLGAEVDLVSPDSGRITAFMCTPNSALVSGQSIVSLNGAPVLTLHTSTPLWRDLAVGDRGEDARALQQELVRLGYPVDVDGVIGRQTVDAVHALMKAVGRDVAHLPDVPQSAVLWIPAPEAQASSCAKSIGEQVATGEPIIVLAEGLRSAHVVRPPATTVEGARVLVVDGEHIALDDSGRVTDVAALAALAATPSYVMAVNAGETSLGASSALAEAQNVAVVSPQSLFGIEGTNACVASAEKSHAVVVIGSELGQSFVTFDGDPPHEVLLDPTGAGDCR